MWQLFTNPAWRSLVENWTYEAHKAVMIFRYSTQEYINEVWFKAFIEELCASSSEFQTWWQSQTVKVKHDERKVIRHPQVGMLALLPTSLQLVETQGLRVVVDMPLAEFDTVTKLSTLALDTANAK